MGIIFTVWLLSVLPFSANSECTECPPECTCGMTETTCTGISEIPVCLPYTTRALTISNSPFFSEIKANAFSDRSYEYLESLTITSTGLETIKDYAFNGTHQLKKIQMSHALGPSYLGQYTLYGLSELQSFEANNIPALNSIGSKAFSDMAGLKTLNLKGNGIEYIDPRALESVYGLQHFDISENTWLVSIPKTLLSHISMLRTISINDCALKTMHKDYFYTSYLSNVLIDFEATGNDWDCNKDMCPFIQWLGYEYDFTVMIAKLGYCSTPSRLYGVDLDLLQVNDVCNSDDGIDNITIYWVISVVCLTFIVLVAGVYRRRHVFITWRQNRARRYAHIEGRDPNFDITAHDRAAIRSPNPPSYGSIASAAPSAGGTKPEEDTPPPAYEE